MYEIIRFFAIFNILPGIVAAFLARNRGRNILGWGLLTTLFPPVLMVIYFNKPLREVPGGFKRCTACGIHIGWKAASCKYCKAPQPQLP